MNGKNGKTKASLTPVNIPEMEHDTKDEARSNAQTPVSKLPTPITVKSATIKNHQLHDTNQPNENGHNNREVISSNNYNQCLLDRVKFLEERTKKQEKEIKILTKDVQQYRNANENNYKDVEEKYKNTEKTCKSIEKRLNTIENKLKSVEPRKSEENQEQFQELVVDIGRGFLDFRKQFSEESKQARIQMTNMKSAIEKLTTKVEALSNDNDDDEIDDKSGEDNQHLPQQRENNKKRRNNEAKRQDWKNIF